MIVPRSRLLFWVGLVVVPFALLGGVEPSAMVWSLLAIGVLLALVLADAFRARGGLAGLSVESPRVARMSKDREASLELRIRNERQTARTVRLALALPRQIQSAQEDAYVTLPSGIEWTRFAWSCLPTRRGNFRLDTACIETSSPLGFWDARKKVPIESELRVYPNLFNERRELAALFLHRGAFGLHAQRQVGKGREFEKLREYVPGDGYDEIHWKATAKRGRPVTKVFQLERTQEVYVIIDASRLSAREIGMGIPGRRLGASNPQTPRHGGAFPLTPALSLRERENVRQSSCEGRSMEGPSTLSPPPSTLERFVTAALVLGLAAEQQGDLFGLLTFTDKVGGFLRAKNGKGHYGACRDALYTLQPALVTPDYDEVCAFIRLRLRRRALLIFLTALDDPMLAESFVRNIQLVSRQHLVVVNMLQPPGVAPLFADPSVSSVDDLYSRLGGHLLWHDLRELEQVLHRRGVQFTLLQNERLSTQLVSQYLNVKRRQLL